MFLSSLPCPIALAGLALACGAQHGVFNVNRASATAEVPGYCSTPCPKHRGNRMTPTLWTSLDCTNESGQHVRYVLWAVSVHVNLSSAPGRAALPFNGFR